MRKRSKETLWFLNCKKWLERWLTKMFRVSLFTMTLPQRFYVHMHVVVVYYFTVRKQMQLRKKYLYDRGYRIGIQKIHSIGESVGSIWRNRPFKSLDLMSAFRPNQLLYETICLTPVSKRVEHINQQIFLTLNRCNTLSMARSLRRTLSAEKSPWVNRKHHKRKVVWMPILLVYYLSWSDLKGAYTNRKTVSGLALIKNYQLGERYILTH